MHSGYKGKNPQPWKKAKTLKFDDKHVAKAEGDLSYKRYKRAAWYVANLDQAGKLDLELEVTPPTDEGEFDLGFEVMDSGFRTIAKSDLEEGDDAGELTKTKSLKDLEPGKYYVHLYLQGRLDTADYVLRATFKAMPSVGQSDFPAQVAFPPPLPMVPLQDDTPLPEHKPTVVHKGPRKETPKEEPKKATGTKLTAVIIGMKVDGKGTKITIALGTQAGAGVGMQGQVVGLAKGTFSIDSCTDRTCTATVGATADEIKGHGSVVLTP